MAGSANPAPVWFRIQLECGVSHYANYVEAFAPRAKGTTKAAFLAEYPWIIHEGVHCREGHPVHPPAKEELESIVIPGLP